MKFSKNVNSLRGLAHLFIAFCLSVTLQGSADATDAAQDLKPAEKKASLKVGGEYTVTKIDRSSSGLFLIEFKAMRPTGRFDVLKLESDHVHVGVKVGQSLRLSAEILAESGTTAEVSQLVMFLKGPNGKVPVWLLSHKSIGTDLRAIRYLEMHVPSNDYVVM